MDHSHEVSSYNQPSRVVTLPAGVSFYNTTGLETQCPYGFVIPDHPSDPDIEWIEGTNCAIACISPVYTREQYVGGQYLIDFIAWVGFIVIIVNLLSHRVSARKPMHYLKLYHIAFAAITTMMNMLQSLMPIEKRYCRDNANGYTGRDGVNLCTSHAVVIIYLAVCIMTCWTVQIWVIFSAIVLGQSARDAATEKSTHLYLVFALPAIPTIILIASGNIGYRKGGSACFTNQVADDNNLDMWCYWVVAGVMAGISFLMLIGIFWKAFKVIVFAKIDPSTRPKIPFSGNMRPESSNASSFAGDSADDSKPSSGTATASGVSEFPAGSPKDMNGVPMLITDMERGTGSGVRLGGDVPEGERPYRVHAQVAAGMSVAGSSADSNTNSSSAGANTGSGSGSKGEVTLSGSSSSAKSFGMSEFLGSIFAPRSSKVVPGPTIELPDTNTKPGGKRGNGTTEIDGDDFVVSAIARTKVLMAPLIFSIGYLCLVVGTLYARFSLYENYDHRWTIFSTWIQCIFENYYNIYTSNLEVTGAGNADIEEYYDAELRQEFAYGVCGEAPRSTVSFAAIVWFFISVFGYPLWVGLVYMKPKFLWFLITGRR